MSYAGSLTIAASAVLVTLGAAADLRAQTSAPPPCRSVPGCEWCLTHEAPADLDWRTTIAGASEPGERLVIRGTVYEPDGVTPAAGVMLYLYHTNAEGVYPRHRDGMERACPHGELRGWLRTDARGRYEIRTIRPGNYPSRDAAAHIHVTVKEPDRPEYWIDDFLFAGDPYLTSEQRGGSNVVALHRDEAGVWRGERDIVLPADLCPSNPWLPSCS